MNLKEKLMADYKTAMREHNVTAKETVNLVRAAIKQQEIDKRIVLEDDSDIIPIIKKQVKMRKDSLADFEKAGREDLIEGCKQELAILAKYLPEQMSDDEIRKVIEKVADDNDIERNMKSMGVMMKKTMKEVGGQADGSAVSKLVKEYLSK